MEGTSNCATLLFVGIDEEKKVNVELLGRSGKKMSPITF
jgi:hypothetical protein